MHTLPYTLVTGASSGLGKAFAIECARMGQNLVLFALPGSQLHSLARYLMAEFNVDVQVFKFDLTDSYELAQQVEQVTAHYPVNFLINNAGIGGTAAITTTTFEKMDQIIQLNVRSTAQLTHLLIPHLLKQEESFILNVSSMAAFTPIAYKTVYPASKAFISSFSLGLREELAGTGLSVSVLYPGPMMTNFNTSRRILSQGRKGKMGLLSTSAIVRIALNNTFARQPVIVPGLMNKLSHFLMSVLPLGIKLKIVSRAVKKEIAYA
jgi:short-subunit dehydrogenase